MIPLPLPAQGSIEGQVSNGTVNQPLPNQVVHLLALRQGMQRMASVSTDAQGRFVFAQREIDPNAFYLIQTDFQGVIYHAPAQFDPAGRAAVNLTVYDSTPDGLRLRIESLHILVRAEGPKVRVQEEYAVENSSRPPRAYANPGGTFHFRLSPRAGEPKVVVTGLLNMPIPQTPEPGKSPGEFSIHYPLKPGVTRVTVAYEADYTGQLALSDRVSYPIERAELHVFPPTLSLDSPVFKPAGVDTINAVRQFVAENLPRDAALEFQLSGEAAPGEPSEMSQGEEQIRTVPNSMSRLGLPLLACLLLVLLWALGVRVAREWPRWKEWRPASPALKQVEARVDALLNSLADLDELFASGKIAEKKYWKERLELKAKLVAILKKAPPALLESYATRHNAS